MQLCTQICTWVILIKISKYELTALFGFPFLQFFSFGRDLLEKCEFLKVRPKITLIKPRGGTRGNKTNIIMG